MGYLALPLNPSSQSWNLKRRVMEFLLALVLVALIIGLPLAWLITALLYLLGQSLKSMFNALRHPDPLLKFMQHRWVRALLIVQMFVYAVVVINGPCWLKFQQQARQSEAKENL